MLPFKVQKVYFIERGRTFKRLRVKIDGHTYYCGSLVKGFAIQRVEASGAVDFKSPAGDIVRVYCKGIEQERLDKALN